MDSVLTWIGSLTVVFTIARYLDRKYEKKLHPFA
jgi:hypothetical protein